MTPTSAGFLPSEAVRAILAFMTRRQLIVLSGVNRQFLHVIDSLQFKTKPLLLFEFLFIQAHRKRGKMRCQVTLGSYPMPNVIQYGPLKGIKMEWILNPRWLRFSAVYIQLPWKRKIGQAWLKLLYKYLHCMREANLTYLTVIHYGEISPEIAELIENLKPLVGGVEFMALN